MIAFDEPLLVLVELLQRADAIEFVVSRHHEVRHRAKVDAAHTLHICNRRGALRERSTAAEAADRRAEERARSSSQRRDHRLPERSVVGIDLIVSDVDSTRQLRRDPREESIAGVTRHVLCDALCVDDGWCVEVETRR